MYVKRQINGVNDQMRAGSYKLGNLVLPFYKDQSISMSADIQCKSLSEWQQL